MDLLTPISALNRVGKVLAQKLSYLGIITVRDLLYYFPFRYDDFRQIVLIRDLRPDTIVTVRGRINLIANRRSFKTKKIITEALLEDSTGTVRVIWFNQPFLTRVLKIGDQVALSGKISADMLGAQLVSPIYEKNSLSSSVHTARLVPIYSLTTGITEKQLRFLIEQVLPLADQVEENLTDDILASEDFVPLGDAIKGIHFPIDEQHLASCVRRLKFDELFALQVRSGLARVRRTKERAPSLIFKEQAIKEFVARLPFVLTKAQKIAAWEILGDLSKNYPTNRLLSGDVGSGKTVVAALAGLNVALNGRQTIFMAPTEILAGQHFFSLQTLFARQSCSVGLLTSEQAEISNNVQMSGVSLAGRKKAVITAINQGQVEIIVGTHALLNDKIKFFNPGLVIVDEQHRFGVEQRRLIRNKTAGVLYPHFLSMTATPIPRSLALTLYGDLDLSVINELPSGRKPVITRVVASENRVKAYDFIRAQIAVGRQAFVVCPAIDEQNCINDKKSVLAEYKKLSQQIFTQARVGYLHGKMSGREKAATMDKMKNHALDILVSTAVVEVGVDIPNASVMMIENAERFGLAQLHQFRGRVGRSIYQSYCLVFSENTNTGALERLRYFEKNQNGFKLAEYDLDQRGPGEVYGTEQSGQSQLRLANLSDRDIIKSARDWAQVVINRANEYQKILKQLVGDNQKIHWE